uniref:AAA ATPase domain-containing protein n=1 Tax=Candidatus Kentrum sp. FW TaxID=2126338 RepID=A0A450TD65_9GAMM|nr:MAG: AAA ATPase domain-containing protein [Candidatus Kentron sp. FW]
MQSIIPESPILSEWIIDFFLFLGITNIAETIGLLAKIAVLIGTTLAVLTYIHNRKKEKNSESPPDGKKLPNENSPNSVDNFRARLGNRTNPGFLSESERLAQIEVGRNPFVTGTELPENSPVFIGRSQIMHEISAVLRHPDKPGCVSLLGERRMGKSSLLNQIFADLANEEGLVTILGSPQGWYEYTPAAFFSDLHMTIEGVIAHASSTNEQAASSFPVMDYPGFRDFIRQHADRYRFILILDEFETMAEDPKFDAAFFANLRHLGNTPEFRFGYLLASRQSLSKLRKQDHGLDSSSFWNIFGIAHTVGLLQSEDAWGLIREPWQRSLGDPLWPKEVEGIEKLIGAHPAFLQMVLDRMWAARAGQYELDLDEIRRALWTYFDYLWRHRSEEEKDFLLKIIDAEPIPDNKLLWDLRSRGLVTRDGRLFSEFFRYFVLSEYSAIGLPSGLETGLDFIADIVKRVIGTAPAQ